jgi:hypothetical protein
MSDKLNGALQTLRHLMGDKCEHFTGGLGACYRAGHSPGAQDYADRCCGPCIAHRFLTCGEVPREELYIDLETEDDTAAQTGFLLSR